MMGNPFQQFMQNPIQSLMNAKFNIPQGMNNPNDILNYLLSTRQISQDQVNQAMNQYHQMSSSGTLPRVDGSL